MKNSIKYFVIAFITLVVVSCSKDDDNPTNNSNKELSLEELRGTWRISYFWDQTDRTSEFSDYLFTFSQENDVMVLVNSISFFGEFALFEDSVNNENYWILETEYGPYESSIEIDAIFTELTEQWIVKEVNNDATVIVFEERYSNNQPEIMHFTKTETINN